MQFFFFFDVFFSLNGHIFLGGMDKENCLQFLPHFGNGKFFTLEHDAR